MPYVLVAAGKLAGQFFWCWFHTILWLIGGLKVVRLRPLKALCHNIIKLVNIAV